MLETRIKSVIRDVPDFPKQGIVFKDITPIFQDWKLSRDLIDHLANQYEDQQIDAVVGIESRGFFFGFPLALKLGIPFVPIRKKGKLPYKTISHSYALEYGQAEVEIHQDALTPGMRVLIHDDLLATGGTAGAAVELVEKLGAKACAINFMVELSFLKGREKLEEKGIVVDTICTY